ncbi:hypothetical protein YC2023_033478 [Brassica napus]
MTETRSQVLAKNATARDTDGATETRFDAIERALEFQNEKTSQIGESVRLMSEAIRMLTSSNQINASASVTSLDRDDVHGAAENNITRTYQHGYRRNHNGMTRIGRIDFPRFDGSKIKEWFPKVEQLFLIDETPEDSKVSFAAMHFDGDASAWHQELVQEDEEALILRNWRGYKNRLKEPFEEVLDDPIAELKELKETEGFAEYHAKFELIRARLKMPEEYLLSAYSAGLRLHTQMHVRCFIQHCNTPCLKRKKNEMQSSE